MIFALLVGLALGGTDDLPPKGRCISVVGGNPGFEDTFLACMVHDRSYVRPPERTPIETITRVERQDAQGRWFPSTSCAVESYDPLEASDTALLWVACDFGVVGLIPAGDWRVILAHPAGPKRMLELSLTSSSRLSRRALSRQALLGRALAAPGVTQCQPELGRAISTWAAMAPAKDRMKILAFSGEEVLSYASARRWVQPFAFAPELAQELGPLFEHSNSWMRHVALGAASAWGTGPLRADAVRRLAQELERQPILDPWTLWALGTADAPSQATLWPQGTRERLEGWLHGVDPRLRNASLHALAQRMGHHEIESMNAEIARVDASLPPVRPIPGGGVREPELPALVAPTAPACDALHQALATFHGDLLPGAGSPSWTTSGRVSVH